MKWKIRASNLKPRFRSWKLGCSRICHIRNFWNFLLYLTLKNMPYVPRPELFSSAWMLVHIARCHHCFGLHLDRLPYHGLSPRDSFITFLGIVDISLLPGWSYLLKNNLWFLAFLAFIAPRPLSSLSQSATWVLKVTLPALECVVMPRDILPFSIHSTIYLLSLI